MSVPPKVRLVLPLAAVVLLGACATKSDVRSLERQMLTELREVQEDQRALMQRIGLAFDSLSQQERRQLTGRGELSRSFSQIEDMLAQLLDMVNQNNLLLQRVSRGGPGMGAVGGGEAGVDVGAGGGDATGMFSAAQQQFNRGAFETARAGFQEFLANHPDHELAPDAQYFLAETYARTDDRERALEEYRRIQELYPDSRRAPTALYRRGIVQLERGNTGEARGLFERILAGYPNSPEADLAEDQLRELRP